MFGYLFGGAMIVPGGGDYMEFLVPGVLGLSVLFGIEATVLAVTNDAAKGITDRFRSLPMSGAAVVGGRGAADLIDAGLGLGALVAAGLAVGWRWHDGGGRAAAALALLLRLAFVWVGVYEWNPVSSTITATRELFGNPGVAQDSSWVATNAQLMAVVWPLVLVAVFLPLAVRRYRGPGR